MMVILFFTHQVRCVDGRRTRPGGDERDCAPQVHA